VIIARHGFLATCPLLEAADAGGARQPGELRQRPPRRPGTSQRFASIASQIAFSRCTPSKRAISCSPVGEVTLISVR